MRLALLLAKYKLLQDCLKCSLPDTGWRRTQISVKQDTGSPWQSTGHSYPHYSRCEPRCIPLPAPRAVAARGRAPKPPQLGDQPQLPKEEALIWLFPFVYVHKCNARALTVPGDELRDTNPFTGFPKQNKLKKEQHCTAPNHLPTV